MKTCIKLLFFYILFVSAYDIYASKINISFEEKVGRSPIVIEGKFLYRTPSYWYGRMIYTSYIFEVNKIFKGDLEENIIEIPIEGGTVGDETLYIPSCGTISIGTGILFLSMPDKKLLSGSPSFSGDTLTKHYIVNAVNDALLYDVMYDPLPVYLENVEKNLYKYIESLTGIKRKIIQNPEVKDVKIREWLSANSNQHLLRQHGVKFNFFKMKYIEGKPNYYNFYLWATSTSGFSELKQAEVVIHYDTKTFGSYGVKNDGIRLNGVFPNSLAYRIYLKDIDSTSFSVNIVIKDKNKGIFQLKNNLVGIDMKIKNSNGNSDIYIVQSKCKAKYFDYDNNCISKYSYLFAFDTLDYPISQHYKPIIESSFPDTLVAEQDTLTIIGKYLISNHARIYFNCSKHPCGTGCIIPQEYYITETDTILRLRIPKELATSITACGKKMPVVSGFTIQKSAPSLGTSSPRTVVVLQ